jgi:hypothetical protein
MSYPTALHGYDSPADRSMIVWLSHSGILLPDGRYWPSVASKRSQCRRHDHDRASDFSSAA